MSECGGFCVWGFEHFSYDLTAEMGIQCRLKHAEIPSPSSAHLTMQMLCGFPHVNYIIACDQKGENWFKEAADKGLHT